MFKHKILFSLLAISLTVCMTSLPASIKAQKSLGITMRSDAVISGHTYKLINVNSNKSLEISDSSIKDGDRAQQWNYNNSDYRECQEWRFDLVGDNCYKITNINSQKALEISNSGKKNGDRAQQWEWADIPCQKWELSNNGDGTYKIQNKNSGKVLEISDSSFDDGERAQQWEWANIACQKWILVELPDDCTNIKLSNAVKAFNKMDDSGEFNYFSVTSSLVSGPNHMQGIARYKDKIYVSQNVTPAIDVYSINNMAQLDKSIKLSTSIKHYGGIQQIGNYLVISAEEKHPDKSVISFYDLRQDKELTNLQILRNDKQAGGVGITNYTKNGKEYYCLAVLSEEKILDFYEADKPLDDPECQFTDLKCSLDINTVKGYSGYSEISLLTDQNQNLYMMGYRSLATADIPTDDYMDLYSIKFNGTTIECKLENSRHVTTRGIPVGPLGPHFRYTGGLYIASDTKVNVLTCQRNPIDSININIFK